MDTVKNLKEYYEKEGFEVCIYDECDEVSGYVLGEEDNRYEREKELYDSEDVIGIDVNPAWEEGKVVVLTVDTEAIRELMKKEEWA